MPKKNITAKKDITTNNRNNLVSYNKKHNMLSVSLMGTSTSSLSDAKIFTALITKKVALRLTTRLLEAVLINSARNNLN
jgi:hypothetical protein